MKNYYQVLGVQPNATNEDIKSAYRKLAVKFHPDKNNGDKYFEERFKEIQVAYDTLIDDNLRKHYNQQLFYFYQKVYDNKQQNTYSTPKKEEKPKQEYSSDNAKNTTNSTKQGSSLNFWYIVSAVCIALIVFVVIALKNYSQDKTLHNLETEDNNSGDVIETVEELYTPTEYYKQESNIPVTNYNQLENGASPLDDCFGTGRYAGQAYIVFKNSNTSDAIVCLVNNSTDKTIRNEYIRKGTDFKMSSIPSGTYYLKVYYGNNWNKNKTNFCGTKGAFEYSESFSKSDNYTDLIQIENNANSYTTGTITLYTVAGGNMGSKNMSKEDFFK